MKSGKRILSLVLVCLLCVGMLPIEAMANDEAVTAAAESTELAVSGTNAVGDLLADALSEQQSLEAEGCSIVGLTIDDGTAVVTYNTTAASDIVVAVYDETTAQMLASGTASVDGTTSGVSILLEGSVPQYFVAAAYLLDGESHAPLCDSYTTELYTQDMQAFLATTAEDYDPELVLNLDEDTTTNFMVYGEDSVLVTEDGEKNQLTDHGDGTYTIVNADSSFTTLEPGDVFSYTYSDGSLLLVKVKSISVDGTTVTITEDENVSLEDFFDYIKIEVGDDAGLDGAIEVDNETSKSVSFDVSKKFGSDSDTLNVELSVSGKLKAAVNFKLYLGFDKQYLEFKLDLSAKFSGSISGKVKRLSLELLPTPIGISPVPGLYINFMPALVFEASGELSFTASVNATVGFSLENGKFNNKSTAPVVQVELKAEVTIFVGFSLEPSIVVLSSKVVKASITAEIGAEIKGSMSISNQQDDDVVHECSACLDGDINGKVNVSASIEFLHNWTVSATIVDYTWKLFDFYYSFDYNEFGWTTCPHVSYKVTLIALDPDGNILSGAVIEGTGLAESPVTGDDGTVVFYLPNGEYTLSVHTDMYAMRKSVTIQSAPKTLELRVGYGEVIDNGTCGDDLTWALTDDGVLTISGTGDMWDFTHSYVPPNTNAPWYAYCEDIVSVVIGSGVTCIGNSAFMYCDNIISVMMPEGITTIGNNAFYFCWQLRNITLPDGLVSIGDSAFQSCYYLKHITIPDSVTSIGGWAFIDSGLTEIVIPGSVTSIGRRAFRDCDNLMSVVIESGVTSIGEEMFYDCQKLQYITIPGSVTSIGDSAFYHCDNLTSITIPEGVTSIGYGAFCRCTNLVNITLPDSLTSIGSTAFTNCYSLTEISIPDGVTTLGDSAFSACWNLTSITIPDSVTTIGYHAFAGCSSLTSITIPDGVTSISISVFSGCTSLESITVPDSMTTIGDWAFYNCSSLTDVYYTGSEVEWSAITVGSDNEYLTNATIHYNSTGEEMAVDLDGAAPLSIADNAFIEENSQSTVTSEIIESDTDEILNEAVDEPWTEPEQEDIPEAAEPEDTEEVSEETIVSEWEDEDQLQADTMSYTSQGLSVTLLAAYTPTTTGEHVAQFDDLAAGADYIILVVQDLETDNILLPENLLYIAQVTADASGHIALSYLPKTDGEAEIAAYGPEKPDYTLGDITGDDIIDLKDVTRLFQFVNRQVMALDNESASDINGDGKISLKDVTRLFQFVNGQIDTL